MKTTATSNEVKGTHRFYQRSFDVPRGNRVSPDIVLRPLACQVLCKLIQCPWKKNFKGKYLSSYPTTQDLQHKPDGGMKYLWLLHRQIDTWVILHLKHKTWAQYFPLLRPSEGDAQVGIDDTQIQNLQPWPLRTLQLRTPLSVPVCQFQRCWSKFKDSVRVTHQLYLVKMILKWMGHI